MQKGASFNLEAVKEQILKAVQMPGRRSDVEPMPLGRGDADRLAAPDGRDRSCRR